MTEDELLRRLADGYHLESGLRLTPFECLAAHRRLRELRGGCSARERAMLESAIVVLADELDALSRPRCAARYEVDRCAYVTCRLQEEHEHHKATVRCPDGREYEMTWTEIVKPLP